MIELMSRPLIAPAIALTESRGERVIPQRRPNVPLSHHAVSNKNMLGKLLGLILVLFAGSLWAQHSYPHKLDETAIRRVKMVDVSSLDRGLPKVTLEFFLNYEAEGVPIKWRMSDCDLPNEDSFVGGQRICVEADIDLKGGRSATILVSVGTVKTGPVGVPTLFRVMITDPNGMAHRVGRLSDLPVELHRALPKSPSDPPLPVGALLLPRGGSHQLLTVVIA